MNISIELIDNTNPTDSPAYPFPIDMEALKEAVLYTTIGTGSLIEPIPIDDFITASKNKLPHIGYNTTVRASFSLVEGEENPNATPLIYCKVQNIGKRTADFTDWYKIFDCSYKHIKTAPDGTLYITPQTITDYQSFCEISTLKKRQSTEKNIYILYSIIFQLFIDNEAGEHMKCYFEFDPLAKISSNV
ncbi:hypothetical protein [Flagellimonas nanhaiensis]|uniref:Uncharacterized protein n=1 Tax=Flagellimonas nanhaiensis TaxID=2292706 RepID=A0A371JRB2_9FLAO|nr:hypothetical protein [Allomuricauda nanhaiensis]RDY60052.1 hypothetical protein DX873_11985 [Allomuricauda nanhaiensis]